MHVTITYAKCHILPCVTHTHIFVCITHSTIVPNIIPTVCNHYTHVYAHPYFSLKNLGKTFMVCTAKYSTQQNILDVWLTNVIFCFTQCCSPVPGAVTDSLLLNK